MEHVEIMERPDLHDTILIAAFTGWNDAGEVASSAVRFLVREWGATKFARLEPDEFYVFTESRPQVRLTPGGGRRIEWIANDFWYRPSAPGRRDVALLVGVEPQLRWRAFVQTILDVAALANVTTLVTLGGLLADVPHSRPARVSGSSNDHAWSRRLADLGVTGSRYEGPTGILGVFNSTAGQRNLTTFSMWGNVPHYVSASLNPKVTGGLLGRLDTLFGFGLDLREWEAMTLRFDAEIAAAIARNPQIAAYVRELEARDPGDELAPDQPPPGDLPDSATIVRELEEFLLRNRTEPEDDE